MQVYGPNTTPAEPIRWQKTSSGVAMAKTMVAVISTKTTVEKVYFAAAGTIAPDNADYSTFVLTLHDGAGDTPMLSFDTTVTSMGGDGITVGYWEDAANPLNLALAAPITITPPADRPATISLTIAQTGAGATIPPGMLHLQCTRPG